MLPQKAMVLPSTSLLPSTDAGLVRAIDDIALIAEGLIDSVDAALLTIALPSDRWNHELPLVVWTQRLDSCPALARTLVEKPLFAPAFDALCMAADALFARLEAWGWAAIDAPGLCLVTDGVGIVLSPARPPADADCGWLLALARPDSGAAAIRPPRSDGVWSLIAAEAGTAH